MISKFLVEFSAYILSLYDMSKLPHLHGYHHRKECTQNGGYRIPGVAIVGRRDTCS